VSTPTIDLTREHEGVDPQVLIPEVRRRTRRRRLIIGTIVLAVVAALVVGVVSLVDASNGAARPRSSPGPTGGLTSGAPITTSAPTLEVYAVVPGSVEWNPPIFAQRVGSSAPPQFLTRGIAAQILPAIGSDNELLIDSGPSFETPFIYRVQTNGTLTRILVSGLGHLEQGQILLASGRYIYDDVNGVSRIDTRTSAVVTTGGVIKPFANPYNVSAPLRCEGVCAGAWTDGLVQDAGRLYALDFSDRSASILDLTSGTGRAITGYDVLRGAAVGADGDIYVTANRLYDATAHLVVLRIDPTTLGVVGTLDTGVSPDGVDNVVLQTTTSGTVLVYVARQRTSTSATPMDDYAWSASATGLRSLGPLPVDLGLDMRTYGHNVYFFGGPAHNLVSRLNIGTLTLTRDISALAAPRGTYVFALD
jgi:hypothetical protein